MSLNCLSGLFFILDHLIIKGCKLPNLFNCCLPWRRTSTEAWQFKFVSEREDEALLTQRGRYFYKVCLFCFLSRRCCYIGASIRQNLGLFYFFFCKHRKKREKERKIEGKLVSNLRKVRLGFGHRSKEKTLRNQNSTSETCISFFRRRF